MRATIHLTAQSNCKYSTDYEHKLRGVFYNALQDSKPELHSSHQQIPFTFSNIYPPEEIISEGDTKKLTFASYDDEIFFTVLSEISNSQVTVGEMIFRVNEISIHNTNVSQRGSLSTPNGVYCEVPSDREHPTYWKPNHGLNSFKEQIESTLDWKIDTYTTHSSEERNFPIFNSYELIKQYSRPYTVETSQQLTFVLSKWKLDYDLENSLHRSYINIALDTGLGKKNTLGLGFVNQDSH